MLETRPRFLYHHDTGSGESPNIPGLLTEIRTLQQTTNLTPEEQEDDMYYEQYIRQMLEYDIVDDRTGQTAHAFLKQNRIMVLKVGSFAYQDSDHNGRAGEIGGSILFLGDKLGGLSNRHRTTQLNSIARAFAEDQDLWPTRSGVYRPYFYTGVDMLEEYIRNGWLEVSNSIRGTKTDFGTIVARIITAVPLYSEDQREYKKRQQKLLDAVYQNSTYSQKIAEILTGHIDKRKRRRGL